MRRIQRAADPSRRWFEGFRHWTSFEPEEFAFHHVARTRILTYGTLVVRDEAFVRMAESRFAARAHAQTGAPPVHTRLRIREVEFPNRIVATQSPFVGAGLVIRDIGALDHLATLPLTGMWLRTPNAARWSADIIGGRRDAALLLLDGISATNLDLVASARAAWPPDRLLGVKIDAWEDPEDDAANDAGLALARELKARGCDLVVIAMPQPPAARDPERAREAHAHASDLIRNLAGIPTMMLGGDYSVGDVNALILAGRTDLCEWPRLAWAGWRPIPPQID